MLQVVEDEPDGGVGSRRGHRHPVAVADEEHAALGRRRLQLRERLTAHVGPHLVGAVGQPHGRLGDAPGRVVAHAGGDQRAVASGQNDRLDLGRELT